MSAFRDQLAETKARATAEALAPRFADALVDLAHHGRSGLNLFGRVPYLVDSVLRDQGLIDRIGGDVTPFGREVARAVKALGLSTDLARSAS